jgi:hypothetical protein
MRIPTWLWFSRRSSHPNGSIHHCIRHHVVHLRKVQANRIHGPAGVEVTNQRTRTDWARVVRHLVDVDYTDRERIVLVMDNLNIHHPASLYEDFEPA